MTDLYSVASMKLLRDDSTKSQWAEKLLAAAQMPFESVSTTDRAKLPILVFSSKQGIVELVGLPLIKACAQWFARAVVVSMLYNTAAKGPQGTTGECEHDERCKGDTR